MLFRSLISVHCTGENEEERGGILTGENGGEDRGGGAAGGCGGGAGEDGWEN